MASRTLAFCTKAVAGAVFGLLALGALPAGAADDGSTASADKALAAAVAAPLRDPNNTARDKYRHPAESLAFWGLKPGMTVVEIWPAPGYWTEIIAPYLRASSGHYIAAVPTLDRKLPPKFDDVKTYGDIGYVIFNKDTGALGAPGSADLVLTARNIHDWMWTPGFAERAMGDFFKVLKPGGILAVEEHRADPRPTVNNARDGYVNTADIVAMAEKAGFKLDAKSEINANPKDTKDYPFGVWTLPPTRRSAPPGQPADPKFDHSKYDAIGESDRMTLRFKKP
jgi:predicted methyltransferase